MKTEHCLHGFTANPVPGFDSINNTKHKIAKYDNKSYVTNIKLIYCYSALPVQIVTYAWDGKAGPETHCLSNLHRKSIHSF